MQSGQRLKMYHAADELARCGATVTFQNCTEMKVANMKAIQKKKNTLTTTATVYATCTKSQLTKNQTAGETILLHFYLLPRYFLCHWPVTLCLLSGCCAAMQFCCQRATEMHAATRWHCLLLLLLLFALTFSLLLCAASPPRHGCCCFG